MANHNNACDDFNALVIRFSQLVYSRTEDDLRILEKILNDLNSLNYRYPVVTSETRAVLIVNQFCNLISFENSDLVSKCCVLVTSFVTKQNVIIEGRTLMLLLEWMLQAIKVADNKRLVNMLFTLDTLLRINNNNDYIVQKLVLDSCALLDVLEQHDNQDIVLLVLACLDAICLIPNNYRNSDSNLHSADFKICLKVFLNYVCKVNVKNSSDITFVKILITSLKGINNILMQFEDLLKEEIGLFLGIVKSYMVYQLAGIDFIVPQKLLPSTLSIPEPTNCVTKEKKGGKVAKQRKQRLSNSAMKKDDKRNDIIDNQNNLRISGNYVPASSLLDIRLDSNATSSSKIKTSDSDLSDSETGRLAKLGVLEGRVRQAALNILLTITQNINKRTMFSYWTSFIPDTPMLKSHTLTHCILKDPSPKACLAALNVLLVLLSNSKIYLVQAEYSAHSCAFTPFSVTLCLTIKELHRCLTLALCGSSVSILTQVMKCLAALIQATPYHRLQAGLTSKVIRCVKKFIYHKIATVQVAALIVFGCLLTSDPPVKETQQAFLRTVPEELIETNESNTNQNIIDNMDDLEFVEFSSDEEESDFLNTSHSNKNSTPVPWLLEKCLHNLGVNLNSDESQVNGQQIDSVPAPVKLESLQVIAAMSRNYFEPFILTHLDDIRIALDTALSDKYLDVRLHAGRTLDFLGQAIDQYLINTSEHSVAVLTSAVALWNHLLFQPLMSLLQCDEHQTLRAIGCDCLSSIGATVYERLSKDRQVACIVSLFGCTRDSDAIVRGAAVRALAILVLYPSLKEDIGFIVDLIDVVHNSINDENMGLRMKSSWSLANLSDALVASKSANAEQLTSKLLLLLINDALKSCTDNDKIKSNSIRALGNVLSILDKTQLEDHQFIDVAEKGIDMLVKCASHSATMKVRWNACYAMGIVLKNASLFKALDSIHFTKIFNTLTDLVVGFKNFKVRINAATALASCTTLEQYGQQYFHTWKSLIQALENSANMEDYTEYKHRDHLIEQICFTLVHLLGISTIGNLLPLKETFSETILKLHFQKVYQKLIPEKTTALFSVQNHLKTLMNSDNKLKDFVPSLINILSIETY